jgi:DNA-binding IclR family transcriptional regulator
MILGEEGLPMRISEITRRLGIDKSSAYRIVSTLHEQGFVEQDTETRKYFLGVKVIEVASLKLRSIRLLPTAKPVMHELMQRTRESIHLSTLVEGEVMYLDSEECSGVFNVNTLAGGRAPLHSSAVGKALLAGLPQEEVDRLIAVEGLTQFTDRTIINLQEFHSHLAGIREHGWAIDDEETYAGVRCLAANIRDHRGVAVGSVGLSGPAQRVTNDRIPILAQLVKEAAAKISRQLGYVPAKREAVPVGAAQETSFQGRDIASRSGNSL